MRVVILDLDETLGAFRAFAAFLRAISPYLVPYVLFAQMLDQHPEYLRPGILELLSFLNDNRRFDRCRVVLYTNNASAAWVDMAVRYFQERVAADLFSAVVHGAHPRRLDPRKKSLDDLLQCIKVPPKTEFLAVDDCHHEALKEGVAVYVQITPYDRPGACDLDKTANLFRILSRFLQGLPVESRKEN